MSVLEVGDPAPGFSLPTDGNGRISLSDLKGNMVVLYFYPKDDTPGCTKEAIAFTHLKEEFDAYNVKIIGVSKDTPQKHDKFKTKHNLDVTLASDEAGSMIENYGVWVEKNMYGRKYMGIERATFLIGSSGKILKIWRKVRVKDHAESVLESVKEFV
ncbi:MAG: thioredoxin-dependent thiol peroxidase [Hyphomonadaceae bacterium]|nr:thioredoxin-dependent thiol peroxidase [Hyphomonadaceae bacterium]